MHSVSVIIPIYNAENTLSKCLDSIVNQSHDNYEIILIDDGSTDKSIDICKMYNEQFSNISIYKKNNGGASSARNLGIKKATTDWICFLDSDDFVSLDYLLNLSLYIGNSDLNISGLNILNKKNDTYAKISFPDIQISARDRNFYLNKYPITNYGHTVAKLYKRELIKSHNLYFDEDIHMFEDAIFNLKYFLFCEKITYSSFHDYNYVIESANSLSNRVNSYKSEFKAYQKTFSIIVKDYKISITELRKNYPPIGECLANLLSRCIATLYIKGYDKDYCLDQYNNFDNADWLILKYFYHPSNIIKKLFKHLLLSENYKLADILYRMSLRIKRI